MVEDKKRIATALAENLGMLRKKIKITQEELAEKIGVSRHTIIAIESGKKEMNWSICLALIMIFSENDETKNLLEFLEIIGDNISNIISVENNFDGGKQ